MHLFRVQVVEGKVLVSISRKLELVESINLQGSRGGRRRGEERISSTSSATAGIAWLMDFLEWSDGRELRLERKCREADDNKHQLLSSWIWCGRGCERESRR